MLKTFDLDLNDNTFVIHGAIGLDFRNQASLKQIKIKHTNCRYYTFYHEYGRYWKNINISITQEMTSKKHNQHLIILIWLGTLITSISTFNYLIVNGK